MTAKEREEAALKDGIALTDVGRLIAWTADYLQRNQIRFPDLFFSKKAADEFLEAFAFDRSGWHLLAIGLRRSQVEYFLVEFESAGRIASEEFGIADAVRRREVPDGTGRLIGFDVLATGYGERHSWFCNSLEEPVATELGIRPGAYGLLATWSQADACAEYAARPETGAEPLPWYAWAVISYPI